MPTQNPSQTLYTNRFVTGLYTQRNPLVPPGGDRIDALIDGLNVDISNEMSIHRRFGYSKFSTAQLGANEILQDIYTFRDLDGNFQLIIDTNERVGVLDASTITNIFTKTDSRPASFLFVADVLYIAHPDANIAWDGATSRKWGIDPPDTAPTLTLFQTSTANIEAAPTGAVRSGNVVTITTTAAHGFLREQTVSISGVSDSSFNGTFVITSVPSSTTFTYSQTGPDATSGSGTATIVLNNLVATEGYVYAFTYKSTTSGHVSTGSPRTASTGSFSNTNVHLEGPRSTDPQVDKVQIYRTADGGSTLFFVAEIDNPASGTWAFVDSTQDINLGTLSMPEEFSNNPPPSGLDNLVFHMGRVWGSVDNQVFFAGGPDVLNGVPEEAWPPANVFAFPSKVTKLTAFPGGLIVWTPDSLFLVRGMDLSSFFASPWQNKLGIQTRFAADVDGEVIYAFTSDRQLVRMDANGISEISFPIGPLLENISPKDAFVSVHRQGTSDVAVYLSDGNDTVYRLSLTLGGWSPKHSIAGGVRFCKSVEIDTGQYAVLIGRPTGGGFVLKRDPTVFTDDGQSYSAYLTFGSLLIVPPGRLAEIDSVIYEGTAVGNIPSVLILVNDFGPKGLGDGSGDFVSLGTSVSEPPTLSTIPTTFKSRRFYVHPSSATKLLKHLQVKVDFGVSTVKDEITGIGLVVAQYA